jgi:hypothetical protein
VRASSGEISGELKRRSNVMPIRRRTALIVAKLCQRSVMAMSFSTILKKLLMLEIFIALSGYRAECGRRSL